MPEIRRGDRNGVNGFVVQHAAHVPHLRQVLCAELFERGGALVIPAFAIGRTQEVLYHLRHLEDAGSVPRLPVYIDSLYRPRAGQALASYFDVERVEVLKGPQGTLFGRNTPAGVVKFAAPSRRR